jgi:hypothetical protein
MIPENITGTQKEYLITHKCIVCGYKKNNKVAPEDNFDAVIAVVKTKKS